MSEHDFDAVVVGSGFGGSVTAYRLRTGGKSVCLLERGKRYNPGDFPRSPSGLAKNVWNPAGGRYGMFEVWMFDHIEAVVSSALGGGSIIYANVLLEKPAATFTGWPLAYADLVPHYADVRTIIAPQPYPFQDPPYDQAPKVVAFERAARTLGVNRELPPLAVTFANPGRPPALGEPIVGTTNRFTCRLCGECNVGCNFGSKNTLDFNYLKLFEDAKGVKGEIRTLAEVTSFKQCDGGFCVEYQSHDPKCPGPHRVTAQRLVLAAGSLGTTYLLLRNADTLDRSPDRKVLGSRWCGNGDFLASLKNAKNDLDPERGPVITTALEYDGGRYYIEDGGYPAFLEWVIEGMGSPSLAGRALRIAYLRAKDRMEGRRVSNISREVAAMIGLKSSSRTLPLLGMGDDVPDGKLSLSESKTDWLENDWSEKSSKQYFADIEKSMKELAGALDAEFSGDMLLRMNKLITAHPVGGCPMGTRRDNGVVDQYGRVFGVTGLSIADGSILPGPVGPNPSLTIAAIADRAATYTLAHWQEPH